MIARCPATYTGDLDEVSGSWVWSGTEPVCCEHWESEPVDRRSFSLLCVWLFGISENKHKTGTWVRKQNGKAYWKGRKAQTESTKGSEKDFAVILLGKSV